jgi:1-phosphofructokinase family hexose kinase
VERALEQEGVQYHFVRAPGQTRVNVTIVEEGGNATSLYGPGPVVPSDRFEVLLDLVHVWLQPGTVLVLAGSLPEGVSCGAYADLVGRAHERGASVIVGAAGEPLARALQARPDLVKPNVAEAERLVGRRLDSRDAVAGAAREIVAMGARTVVLSMGARGAVCTSDGGSWFVKSPSVTRRSTVGSGDAMVAGLAIALAKDAPPEYALRLGAAAGAASAMAEGTALGSPGDVQALLPRVEIENIG